MDRIYVPAESPDDWKRFLAHAHHWKEGFSAHSLAYAWHKSPGDIPVRVKHVLGELGQLRELELLVGLPELKTPLPGGGRASQTDLFVLARDADGELVAIGVEGKVDEPFGEVVNEWLKDPSEGKRERLAFLCKILEVHPDDMSEIRYQLLHRTAAAILEARRFTARRAIMLVHSFSAENTSLADYLAFAKKLQVDAGLNRVSRAGTRHGVELYLAWVNDA